MALETQDKDNAREITKGKLYLHYKGKKYLVLEIATHSETMETVVVYQAMYGERKVWVRPLRLFAGSVHTEQGAVDRFTEAALLR